jgi:transposase
VIQLTPHMRILVAVDPVDFRKGIDGLAQVAREALRAEPMSGCVFVFRNRCASTVKLLVYDGQGFWLAQKRLSSGRFGWWPRAGGGAAAAGLEAHELQLLLYNGNPRLAPAAPAWRRLALPA